MTKRVLVLLCGLPRSGKSIWAAQARGRGAAVVNPDAIRLAIHGQVFLGFAEPLVWAIAYIMARALFFAGHEWVVVDATNVTTKRRQAWIDALSDCCEIQQEIIDTPPDECIRRARAGNREDLIPVIERMAKDWDLHRPVSWGEAK